SPLLRKKVARGLSAGRVQSVAVRLIVEREREIRNFKPEEFWKITALLAPEGTVEKPKKSAKAKAKPKAGKKKATADGEPVPEAPALPEVPAGAFLAELAEWAGQKFKASNAEQAGAIVTALEGATYVVAKVEQKDKAERPAPPFTTSTLQQQASIRLHFP